MSFCDITITVAKLRSINNSLGYQVQKTTGVANSKSIKAIVPANENKIRPNNRKFPLDEGGKSCDRSTTNQNATMCIIECDDRKGAKIVKSITNYQLRESYFSSILKFPNNNFQMTIKND